MSNERRVAPASDRQLLAEAAGAVARGGDLDATLGRLLTLAANVLAAPTAAVILQDPDLAESQVAVSIGLDDEGRSALTAALADPDHPVAIAVLDRTAFSTDAGASGAARDLATALGRQTLTLRPLIANRDNIEGNLGVLLVAWSDAPPADLVALDAIADLAAVAIDRARLASLVAERSEWFERMAHTDPLTGLANHRTFARILELELARAGRQGGEVSVALFDVDDFNATNEAAGHEVGDDILRMVASVLAESVRLVDTVARYGGDEFVLVAPGSAGSMVAQRVLDGVAALPPIVGHMVSVSAGVARFPVDGASADELLSAAEAALSVARGGGPSSLAEAPLPTS